MKIIGYEIYKDGGSINITCKPENSPIIVEFWYDFRINTRTRGELYIGYPNNDNSNLVEQPYLIEKEIINALKEYKNDSYQYSIDNLIAMKQYLFL
jgi:hypothetical protein